MADAPECIGGAKVVMFSALDHRHRPTDACTHIIGGIKQSPFAGLAVCQYEREGYFYLFYCDEGWNPVTDSFHLTLADALRQAEFEYEGVAETWQRHEK